MAERTTVARPYAKAVFEQAQAKKGGLKQWSELLQVAALVATDESIRPVLASPRLSAEEKADLLLDICSEVYGNKNIWKQAGNFIKLLAENHRLNAIPEIMVIFERLRAEAEQTLHAELISAFEVSDEQRDRIAARLKEKLKRDIELEVSVDESLMGGAIIRAGDLVIDGSARGQLARLATALRQ